MFRFRHKRTAAWVAALGAMPLGLWLGQMQDRATGTFELRAVTRAELRAPVAGFLAEIHVEEGDQVSTATLVARLEVPDLASRLAQKRAEVREIEAKLHLLEAGPRQEELDAARHRAGRAKEFRDLAKEELASAGEVLTEELTRLDEKIAQCRAELEHAQAAHARVNRLVSTKAVTHEQYQDAVKAYRVCYARLRQAEAERRGREALGTVEAQAELARRETALADIEATLLLLEAGTRVEEIEAERAHLARLNEEVRYFETLREKLLIKSPVAGAIATPRLKEQIGRYLAEGELICEVEGTEAFEAEIALPEQEAARVRPGQRVELKARALPFRTFSGKVDRIAQRSTPGEAQSTVTVCCRFEDETSQLRPGMTGYARIYGKSRSVGQVMSERVLRVVRTEFWW